jgi:hypothetical protein
MRRVGSRGREGDAGSRRLIACTSAQFDAAENWDREALGSYHRRLLSCLHCTAVPEKMLIRVAGLERQSSGEERE